MRKKLLLTAFMAVFMIQSAIAQEVVLPHHMRAHFKTRREAYFSFPIQDQMQLSQLNSIISIDKIENGNVYAYANEREFTRFYAIQTDFTLLTAPSLLERVEMMPEGNMDARDLNLTAYPTYQQYLDLMNSFASTYPDICQLYTIGTSTEGRALLALKITDNIHAHEYEPQFFYSSTMHGDETAGYILMLDLIDHLLTGYTTSTDVADLVNNYEIWINPLANPDGTYASGNNTVNGATRANANGVDLNRNYPDPQDGPHPDGNPYQAETIAFMAFADTMNFVMAANFHGGAEVFNYPWDTWAQDHVDRDWWINIGQQYVDEVQSVTGTNYFADFGVGYDSPGLTNGFAWYEVNGGRQDYMNADRKCRELTIELSTVKLVAANTFSFYKDAHIEPLKNLIKESTQGFYGIITDSCTGLPVVAEVTVVNHDDQYSNVRSAPWVGNYYRPINPGTYSMEVSAPGYATVTHSNLTIGANQSIEHHFTLTPQLPVGSFEANDTNCSPTVQFTDLSGSSSSWAWDFGDGNTSNEQHPTHTYGAPGEYYPSLIVSNCAGTVAVTTTNPISISFVNPPLLNEDQFASCDPSTFVLNASGSGTIQWYNDPVAGVLLSTGGQYFTPTVLGDATIYAQITTNSGTVFGGAPNNSIGTGGYYTGPNFHYLQFNCSQSSTLRTVKVYAQSAGNRTIVLRDFAGNILSQLTANLTTGLNTVQLNFSIPAASGLQLGVAGGNGLYRNQSGADFPYTVGNTIEITGNSAGNTTTYYYFYDWEIDNSCTSERVPVFIHIGISDPITATLSAATTEGCEGETLEVVGGSEIEGSTFEWFVNGNLVFTETVLTTTNTSTFSSSNWADGDVVNFIVTSPDTCDTNNPATSNSLTITLYPAPPTPTISQLIGGNTLTSSSETGNQWYYNGNPIEGATNNTYEPTQSGDYYVVVTLGCSSAPSNTINVVITGVEEASQLKAEAYPNPFTDQLNIINRFNGLAQCTVYDALGKIQDRFTVGSRAQISTAHWSKGIYQVNMTNGVENISITLIKD
jgi:PKD repeat protein